MTILIPILIFGAIGLVMGVVLAVASKLFYIETDPRVEQISELLPGANCGGCGYAGCSACADAIVKGEAGVNACPGCNQENVEKIAEIMGVKAVKTDPVVARVKCSGTIDKANYKYFFDGSKSCKDIASLQGGDKACVYACLGYGDCVKVCNFNAMTIENGVAKTNEELCSGCGVCATVCPKQVIEILPKSTPVTVLCNSKNKGAEMKALCSAGCIGCRICEKNCESGAIKVEENLAKIDPALCTGCGVCVEKCPKKVISMTK